MWVHFYYIGKDIQMNLFLFESLKLVLLCRYFSVCDFFHCYNRNTDLVRVNYKLSITKLQVDRFNGPFIANTINSFFGFPGITTKRLKHIQSVQRPFLLYTSRTWPSHLSTELFPKYIRSGIKMD
ncbi:hypothetical protein XENTR_v10011138 [Xenopus tropicalis]|nr:hypothetical protein XENTR_v10011138 [Xenopus tropicalis]